jgi:hypothetical protein
MLRTGVKNILNESMFYTAAAVRNTHTFDERFLEQCGNI